jgi:hypothetical protein
MPAPAASAPAPSAAVRRPRWPPARVVVTAFQKAERELGARWQLMGRGHCRRVTLRSWYSRAVRTVTSCWKLFRPHQAGGWLILWPLAVVQRAARMLRVRSEVLIGREY